MTLSVTADAAASMLRETPSPPPPTPDHVEATTPATAQRLPARLQQGWLRALLVVGLCTAVTELLLPYIEPATAITVYLVGVVYVALRLGERAALLAVVASILAFDLLVVEPRWSFAPLDPQYYFTFLVVLVVGILICRLVARATLQTELAEARARRAQALGGLSHQLVSAQSEADIADGLAATLQSTFGAHSTLLLPGSDGRLREARGSAAAAAEGRAEELQRAQALFDGNEPAHAQPDGEGQPMRLLLQGTRGALGVLALRSPAGAMATPEELDLLDAMANQAALALERTLFERQSARAIVEAESERLRNTLLAAISHDLRTPLTTIIGAATSLLQQEQALHRDGRRALLQGLLGEARRVHASMSDLLDLTRMEQGQMRPAFEWCPVDDLLEEVRAALGERLQHHALRFQAPADGIVWCDPRLVVQAAVNLLDNAVRHTPPGGTIDVQLQLDAQRWQLSVRDSGPGLAPGQELEAFKKFAPGRGAAADGSTGLGLAICAAVARLHQGDIGARNDGGACFTLRFPQPAAPAAMTQVQ
jgi:two-component system sensor histidine kinase KdpD